jgi:hypothetical protein
MSRYLVAAEADKIQDFIFRSARLQEVVGGSNLLTRFCKEGIETLLAAKESVYGKEKEIVNGEEKRNWKIVASDGGSFRIWFDKKENAKTFQHDLAEFYRRVADSSLTVATKPEEYDETVKEKFGEANDNVTYELRKAKSSSRHARVVAHIPQMAFCASCGLAIAIKHEAYYEEERGKYLCDACIKKRDERLEYFVGPEEYDPEKKDFFINQFRDKIRTQHSALAEVKLWVPADAVDAIGQFDPRRYVAYLVADGNNMGKFFHACRTEDDLRELSETLPEVVQVSLAHPMNLLKQHTNEIAGEREIKIKIKRNGKIISRPMPLKDVLPVVPLILGGDDIFALLPAPYAVDFTRLFIEKYQELMAPALQRLTIAEKPTISAVVVICKSNYPYKLAHQHGHELLSRAKKMAKRYDATPRSVIDVEVILSSERRTFDEPGDESKQLYRSSMRPFWADGASTDAGILIKQLIDTRWLLNELPHKRLAQLRRLYSRENLPTDDKSLAHWNKDLARLLQRIARMEGAEAQSSESGMAGKVKKALTDLGDGDENGKDGHWKTLKRVGDIPYAHALPDLLRMWDYCYSLDSDKPFEKYQ